MRKIYLLFILLLSSYVANSQTVTTCSGVAVNLTYASITGGLATDDFTWGAAVGSAAFGGTGQLNQLSFFQTLTNTTSAPVSYTYNVTGSFSGLHVIIITVNPAPTVSSILPLNQALCNGTLTSVVSFASPVSNASFSWTGDVTDIGLGVSATGTGNLTAFTTTNISNVPITSIFQVTAISNTCLGAARSFSITVYPQPDILTPVIDQSLCNGVLTTAVGFAGSVTSTSFNWTNTLTSVSLAASGSGTIGAFTATNASNIPVTAVVTVTPVSNSCSGTPRSFSYSVNPTPAIISGIQDQVVCNGVLSGAATFVSSVTSAGYDWTNNVTAIGLAAAGSGTIAAFTVTNVSSVPITGIIQVRPISNSCIGSSSSFSYTINPTPDILSGITDVIRCNGTLTAGIAFSGSVANTTFNWTNNTTSIGLASSGAGTITAFTATNPSAAPVSALISVTAVSNTCNAPAQTFSITVNPTPSIIGGIQDQVVCNGAAITQVTFVSGAANATFNWTNTTTSIGLGASGAGTIAVFTAVNAGSVPVHALIAVTPVSNTCTGIQQSFSLTVNPTPDILSGITDQIRCNGTLTSAVGFTGSVGGTTFTWTNNTSAIGLAVSGSGTIGAFNATNGSALPVTALVTVTPVSNTCLGTPQTFSYTVNPTPSINGGITDQVVCNGVLTAGVTFISAVVGSTYDWSNTTTSIGLAIAGSGTIAAFTAVNASTVPVHALISVTALSNTCLGSTYSFSITVNPTPSILSGITDQLRCNGVLTNSVTFTGSVAGSFYTWTNNTSAIGLALAGTGTINAFTATNVSAAPITGLITVTPVSNTCNGTPQTFSYTVNPTPDILSGITDQALCNGILTSAVSFSSSVAGTTYTWTNNTISVGLAASGGGNIAAFTVTNGTNIPVSALVSVTASSNSCNSTPQAFSITVNPTPGINTGITDRVFCNGVLTSSIVFTSSVPNTTFNWTNTAPSIGIAVSGAGTIAAFTGINLSTAPISALITVTPVSNACNGTPKVFSLTVNPTPDMTAGLTDQVRCAGVITNAVSFSGNVSGTVFNWTNTVVATGLAASGAGNIAAFTVINAFNVPLVSVVTITPLSNSCSGTPLSFSITVNPTPTIAGGIIDQAKCNGVLTTAVAFTGAISNTVYNWTNSAASIGLAASGAGNIAAFTGTNVIGVPVVALITVTPFSNACNGTAQSFSITINPTPTITSGITDQVLCNGVLTTAVTFTGAVASTVFNWTNSATTIGIAASGAGNIAAFTATNTFGIPTVALVTVTPLSNSCNGTPQTFSFTVNPTPTSISGITDQVKCNGVLTTAIAFTGPVSNTVYNWTNSAVSIGLAASGAGNIAAFTATAAAIPTVAVITVTAFSNSCNGTPQSFSITVNPTPNITAGITDQVLCAGILTTAVNFTGGVASTVYNWTNSATTIGLAASGTGNIAAFTGINSFAVPTVAHITVTPFSNACNGTPQSFSFTVNPTPTITSGITDQSKCAGVLTTAVIFTGAISNTVYNWTNTATAIGLAASGAGNIAAFTAISPSAIPAVAVITVTPFSNSCNGTAQSFSITVNPIPTIASGIVDDVKCNGILTTAVVFTGTVASTVFNWTNSAVTIGLAGSGAGNIASFTATNAFLVPTSALITVTPFSNGCNGTPQAFSITVNPTPTVIAGITDQAKCNGVLTTAVIFTGAISNTVYNWTNTVTTIGLAASGAGNIGAFTATSVAPIPAVGVIAVTPFSNSCNGTTRSFSITVNPTPTIASGIVDQFKCAGILTTAVTFTGAVSSTIYNWTNTATSIGLAASGAGTIASFTAINVSLAPTVAVVTVTPFSNACTGTPQAFSITVSPIPTITSGIIDQAKCNGVLTTAIVFTGTISSTVYNWTNTITSTGLAASGAGNIAAFTGVNGTPLPVVSVVTVTPSSNTCSGTPRSFSITINPTPDITAGITDQLMCNGVLTSAVAFSGSVASTVYNWTNTISTIGIAGTGAGNISAFTATNNGSVPVSAYIAITPFSNNCNGTAQTFSITINPTPTVNVIANQAICNTFTTTTVTFTGAVANTAYQWTNTSAAVGLATLSATGNIASFAGTNAGTAPISAVITVTPLSNSCVGTSRSFTITINPTPALNSSLTPTAICNGTTFTYTATSLTAGTVFNWNRAAISTINSNAAGSGIGTINEALLSNTNATTVNVVYAFNLVANGCSNSQTVTVPVNPDAALISTLVPSGICSAATFSYTASASAPFSTVTWTRSTVAGLTSGGPSSGTGNISQTILNSTTAPVTAAYVYAIAVSGCTNANTFTVTFNVNPIPVLTSALTPPNVCSSATFSYFANSATVGTTYSWIRSVVAGIAASGGLTGTGATIFQTLNNSNNALTSEIYQVTLTANGCTASQSVTVGVYPIPVLNTSLTTTPICSNTVFNYTPGSSTATTFNWSRPVVTGLSNTAGSGSNDPNETLLSSSALPVNVIYTYNLITGAGCTNAQTVTVTVNPLPTLSSGLTPPSICTGNLFSYTPQSTTPSTTFNWSRAVAAPVTNAASSGINNPLEVLANPSITPASVAYNFSLTANSCSNLQVVTVIVNPIPIINAQTVAVCSNASFTVSPVNVPTATLYNWSLPTVTPVGSTLGSTTGISQTSISQTLNNQTNSATSAVYFVAPTASGCTGNTFTITVTINPTPVVANQSMTSVCSGTAFNYVASGVPTGTTYTWTNPTLVPANGLTGGGAQALSQASVSQTLSSINNVSDTAIYSVTPATTLCVGNAFLLTVPVKPAPLIANIRDTICSGNAFAINPSPAPANTTYTWAAPVSTPSGALTGGSANAVPTTSISQTLTNATSAYAQNVYTVTPTAANCAGPTFLLTEVVNRAIPVFTTQNAFICSGTSFNATPSNTPTGTTFTWPTPVNPPPTGITGSSASLVPVNTVSQLLSNLNNTIDTVTYTATPSINNCPGIAFTAVVRVLPLPKVTISGPASICQSAPIDTVSLTLNGTAPWSFNYSDGITTNTRTGITSSPYKLTLPTMAKNLTRRTITVMNVKDASCSNVTDTSSFVQTINPLPVGKIISLHGTYLCNGIKDTMFVQSIDSLGYQWKLNGALVSGAITDSIVTITQGQYNALLTNQFGCSDTAAVPVNLTLVKPPVLKFSLDTACVNSKTTFTNTTDTTFTGTLQWLWNFGNGNSSVSMSPSTTYLTGGNYHVTLKATQAVCFSYAPAFLDSTINIGFPVPDTTLSPVSATKGQLTPVASRSFPGYKYQWVPSSGIQNADSASTYFNATTTQQYVVKLISPLGCVTRDSLLVRVFDEKVNEIFVPKSFTPNGDGVNDILYPYIAGIKQFHYFRILNRYGKLLFETKTQDNGWNGMVNGVQQPMGVYFWVAEGVAADGSIVQKNGQLLLVR